MEQTAGSMPLSKASEEVLITADMASLDCSPAHESPKKKSIFNFEIDKQVFTFKPTTPASQTSSSSSSAIPQSSSSSPSIFGKAGGASLFGTSASANHFASMVQQNIQSIPVNKSTGTPKQSPILSIAPQTSAEPVFMNIVSPSSVASFDFNFGNRVQPSVVDSLSKTMESLSIPSSSSPTFSNQDNNYNTPKKAKIVPAKAKTVVVSDSSDQGESETELDGSEEGSSSSMTDPGSDDESILSTHLGLLDHQPELDDLNEIKTAPIFTEPVRQHALSLAGKGIKNKPFSQYGLLAGDISPNRQDPSADPRIFWNIAAPSSFFICGSQGSGKSHTLSCLLENALAPCKANVLPRPLTGIVFHYDTFISDSGGSPCEAAWLSSNKDIKVRVLCPPTNFKTMQKIYKQFPRIKVEELRLNESDLNTKRMLDLMAVSTGGSLPLYLHVAQRILRDLRITQQHTDTGFNYTAFKKQLALENLTEMQLAPLKQRLDTLESFMVESQAKEYDMFNTRRQTPKKKAAARKGTDWTPRNGTLTIVDLSCPCVSAETACSLFNICLSLFLEQESRTVGRVIALDEAHKYMTDSQECMTLTESLLATIRLQRHLGARILISTQEPTISPKLLDLCSVTVVHRFTSPDWLNALRKHLAGVSSGGRLLEKAKRLNEENADSGGEGGGGGGVEGAFALSLGQEDPALELFSRIVDLRVGEALMFAPSAIVALKKKKKKEQEDEDEDADESGSDSIPGLGEVKRLAHGVLKVRIRNRTTADGGRSIMAA